MKNFCLAPWLGISLRNNSSLSVCANSSFSVSSAEKVRLSDALNVPQMSDKRFVDTGRASEINLTIYTNGIFVKEHLGLLSQFSNISTSFMYTPQALRSLAIQKIENSNLLHLPVWPALINLLKGPELPEQYQKFLRFTKKLDEIRKDSLYWPVRNWPIQ